MRVRVAIALGLVVVIGVLVVVLSKSEQRLAASNAQVTVSGADVPIRPRKTACQLESVAARQRLCASLSEPRPNWRDRSTCRSGAAAGSIAEGNFGFVAGRPAGRGDAVAPDRPRDAVPARVSFAESRGLGDRLAGDRTPLQGGANPYGVDAGRRAASRLSALGQRVVVEHRRAWSRSDSDGVRPRSSGLDDVGGLRVC